MKKLLPLMILMSGVTLIPASAQQSYDPLPEVGTEEVKEFDNSPVVFEETGGQVKVYPNPSTGGFNVTLTDFDTKKVRFELLDVTGKRIQAGPVFIEGDKTLIRIDLSDYPNGVYLLQIESEGSVKTVQLFKQRN